MKKKFENPELTIITFVNDDIITGSGEYGDSNGEWTDPEDPDDQLQ